MLKYLIFINKLHALSDLVYTASNYIATSLNSENTEKILESAKFNLKILMNHELSNNTMFNSEFKKISNWLEGITNINNNENEINENVKKLNSIHKEMVKMESLMVELNISNEGKRSYKKIRHIKKDKEMNEFVDKFESISCEIKLIIKSCENKKVEIYGSYIDSRLATLGNKLETLSNYSLLSNNQELNAYKQRILIHKTTIKGMDIDMENPKRKRSALNRLKEISSAENTMPWKPA